MYLRKKHQKTCTGHFFFLLLHGEKKNIEWGSQIRNYVLYPYQLVKDVRTGVEKTDSAAVLDGDLDDFMLAMLSQ